MSNEVGDIKVFDKSSVRLLEVVPLPRALTLLRARSTNLIPLKRVSYFPLYPIKLPPLTISFLISSL
jgi:hypothetical protein